MGKSPAEELETLNTLEDRRKDGGPVFFDGYGYLCPGCVVNSNFELGFMDLCFSKIW